MSQKKCGADRGPQAMRRLVVATAVDQLDCAPSATQSGVGVQMDLAVSSGRADVVSGALSTTTPDGPACVGHIRAGGHPHPCSAHQSTQSAGVVRRGSHRAGVGRRGSPPRPQYPRDSPHFGPTQVGDPPTPRPVSARPQLPTPPARRLNDVHQLDFIVGHCLAARRPVVIVNRKDMATGLVGGTEAPDRRIQRVRAFLTRDWHRHGRPRFLQWTTT